jgi:hypothetical protein
MAPFQEAAMRLFRVRFTLRRMMVAVAIAAVAIVIVVKPFLDSARRNRTRVYHIRQATNDLNRAMSVSNNDQGAYEKLIARSRWHQHMAERYARSAANPQMPEPKEPPPPDP